MGILNVTPDSFFDGGRYLDQADAVRRGRQMAAEGADVIDVGGESTRPKADPVPAGEELRRVIPVVEALAGSVRVSIDTTKPEVARRAVLAGATMINDVSASLATVAAEMGVAFVAMHRKGTPADMQDDPRYDDVVEEVSSYLTERARLASEAGVEEVWVDPGYRLRQDGPAQPRAARRSAAARGARAPGPRGDEPEDLPRPDRRRDARDGGGGAAGGGALRGFSRHCHLGDGQRRSRCPGPRRGGHRPGGGARRSAAVRGRWAAGIVPRNFTWIIKDRLAISERPGGYAPNHRRVRRQEELLWLRAQGFDRVVSMLSSSHNLHAYDEFHLAWSHFPLALGADPEPVLAGLYPAMKQWLKGGERILDPPGRAR